MVSKRVLVNLATFFLISFGLVLYGAVTLLGNPLAERRTATAVFPDASGLLEDFSASMNGVVVGQVTDVELEGDAARVTVSLDPGQELPGDVEASIVRASAVGEQRIEFTPMRGGDEPPLPDGAEVPVAENSDPPQISRVIDTLNGLLEAIPPEDLNTVVHESATALRGREDDLRALTRNLDVVNREFVEHEAEFRELLESSPAVLDALTEVAPELRSAVANTADLTGVLAARRDDLTELMRNGADLGDVADDLVTSQSANLACLASDFAALSDFAASPGPLADLDYSLENNQNFFGPVNALAVEGHAIGFPEYGSVERNDQGWLRVQTMVPPGEPPASRYSPLRATPDIAPGGACVNEFGRGAGPATQADPPEPTRRGAYDEPATVPVDLAAVDGSSASATSDQDAPAGGTGDTPRGDDTEASRGGATEPEPAAGEAAAPIRSDEPAGDDSIDWFTVAAGVVFLLAVAGIVKVVGALRRSPTR